jgi:hypothetical protein
MAKCLKYQWRRNGENEMAASMANGESVWRNHQAVALAKWPALKMAYEENNEWRIENRENGG